MRLIDADALKTEFDRYYDTCFRMYVIADNKSSKDKWEGKSLGVNWGRNIITDAPTVDAVEVVRCAECINRGAMLDNMFYCHTNKRWHEPNHYCGYGRKEGN